MTELTEMFILENSYWSPEVTQQILQDQKLRELIKKEIRWCDKNALRSLGDETKEDFFNFMSKALTSLLEDSKKI